MPKRDKALRSVKPNAGTEAIFKRKLRGLIDEMHQAVQAWVTEGWRAEPELAQDSPASDLRAALAALSQRWQRRFDDAAQQLAEYFAEEIQGRSDAALRAILRGGGYSVKFRMTKEMRDILDATIGQQVGLIKSIPQKYLGDVEGMVMRSVQAGRDLGELTGELQATYGVTKKRASLIARDQNNKATSAMVHARQEELGIEEAVWMHSHAGKEPRPTHVKMNGKRYKLSEGMYDPAEGRRVFPGELINCRCTSRPIIRGLG